MRVCSVAGCPTIYDSTTSRCATHAAAARALRTDNSVYNTSGHKQFRRLVLTRDPVCVICNTARSTVADHYPLTRRQLQAQRCNPDDPRYGRGLCATCHNKHTAATSPGGWAARTTD